jgi:hypothetical protein
VTWVDPTKSLKHLPLEKTNQGWRVLENGFYHFDEQTYYEDKFAIMLAESCEAGASGTAHLGPKPLTDKPANWHGKGFHYSKDGNIRDIWHWKAVRTNDMFIADDNFFGLPDIARPAQRRYTAGYLADGKESGAYIMNWQWYSNQTVLPKRLPEQILLTSNYSPANWVTPWYDTQPYQPSLDSLDEGSLLPSVLLYSNRYEGDRADVRARGEWNDGRWSLELVRPLTTTSEYDVGIETGICLWVSAFDQSQIAHTRHARPLLIRLGN